MVYYVVSGCPLSLHVWCRRQAQMFKRDRNISWSMAKSFISALIGIAVDKGQIDSIEQTVDVYAPMLKGSGYEGVRIKDVLQMSSGVAFNEDYGDFYSDINRWGRDFAIGNSQDDFAASLKRGVNPGTKNHYVSIDTHVLSMVLSRSTGPSAGSDTHLTMPPTR